VVESENVLSVNAASGIRSLADLVAAAKAKPGVLTFASAGNASPGHLCGEMIKQQTGIDMIHVPYTAAAPAMNALLAGDVTVFCGPLQLALPHIKAGSILPLGISGPTPSALLPGVAPLSESYPGLVIVSWYGLLAPAGTPASIVDMLRNELKKISADAELKSKLAAIGLEPTWISGPALSERIAKDIAKWRDVITTANVHAE